MAREIANPLSNTKLGKGQRFVCCSEETKDELGASWRHRLCKTTCKSWKSLALLLQETDCPLYTRCLEPGFSNYGHSLRFKSHSFNMSRDPVFARAYDEYDKVAPDSPRPYNMCLLGHSFVRRLDDRISEVGFWDWAEGAKILDLLDSDIDIYLRGRGGAKLWNIEQFERILVEHKPRAVILDTGSNDLCNKFPTVEMLALDTFTLAKKWITKFDSLQIVLICLVIHRDPDIVKFSGSKTTLQYNIDVDNYNRCLKNLCDKDERVFYWVHKKMSFPKTAISTDGIHPNTVTGLRKYAVSITHASRYCRHLVNAISGHLLKFE